MEALVPCDLPLSHNSALKSNNTETQMHENPTHPSQTHAQVHDLSGVDTTFTTASVMGPDDLFNNKPKEEMPSPQVFDSNTIATGNQSIPPAENSFLMSNTYTPTSDMISPSSQSNPAPDNHSSQPANASQSHPSSNTDPNAVAQQILSSRELCRALHSASVAANEQTGLLVRHTELLLNQAVRAASTNSSTNDALFGLVLQSGSASVADTVARSVISLINTARRSLSSLLIRAEGGNQPTLSSIPIPESLTQLAQYDIGNSSSAGKPEPPTFSTPTPASASAPSVLKAPVPETSPEIASYSQTVNTNQSAMVNRKRSSPGVPPPSDGAEVPEAIRASYAKRMRARRQQEPTPEDPWQWYKYGERPIKNTAFFRSYYRCSRRDDAGCTAKKLVDHHPQDSSLLRVFFEGSHTHAAPLPMERRRLLYHLPDLNRQLANGNRPAMQSVQNMHGNVPGSMNMQVDNNLNNQNNGGNPNNASNMPNQVNTANINNTDTLSITWHNSEPMVNVTEAISDPKVKIQASEGTGMEEQAMADQIMHSEVNAVNADNVDDGSHANNPEANINQDSINHII